MGTGPFAHRRWPWRLLVGLLSGASFAAILGFILGQPPPASAIEPLSPAPPRLPTVTATPTPARAGAVATPPPLPTPALGPASPVPTPRIRPNARTRAS